MTANKCSARATDGNKMEICESRIMSFSLRRTAIIESMGVIASPPITLLMGSHFGKKDGLDLNLATEMTTI